MVDKNVMEIELTSPAINLVGFEHKASTELEVAAVKNIELQLGSPQGLFAISGGGCSLKHQLVNVSSLTNKAAINEKSNGDTEHHLDSDKHSAHGEVTAHYHYYCENIANITAITLSLFDLFPHIDQVQAMWVTDVKQGAVTLSPQHNVIKIK